MLAGSYVSEIMYSTLSTFQYKQHEFFKNVLYKVIKINKQQFSRSIWCKVEYPAGPNEMRSTKREVPFANDPVLCSFV